MRLAIAAVSEAAAGLAAANPAVADSSSAVGSGRNVVESTNPQGRDARAPNGGQGRNDERCAAVVTQSFPVGEPDTQGQTEPVAVVAQAAAATAVERYRKTD